MRGCINILGTKRLAKLARENWTDQRGNTKRQEINRACRTPLDLIRIDFLDDGVGNHGGPRGDAADEQRKPCRHKRGRVKQLAEPDQHDDGAPEVDWLAADGTGSGPTKQSATRTPSQLR